MRWPLNDYIVTQGYSSSHQAFDLAAKAGTPVKAPVSGTVISIGTNPSYVGGLYVVIREDHPDGWEYYTGHHSSVGVKLWQHVSESEIIAAVGATGKATGPHVHFQVRKRNAGALMHPQDVFNARKGVDNMAAANSNVDEGGLNTLYEAYFGRKPDAAAKKTWIGQPWQAVVFGLTTSKEAEDKRKRDAEVYAFYEANKGKTSGVSPMALQLEQLIKQIAKG